MVPLLTNYESESMPRVLHRRPWTSRQSLPVADNRYLVSTTYQLVAVSHDDTNAAGKATTWQYKGDTHSRLVLRYSITAHLSIETYVRSHASRKGIMEQSRVSRTRPNLVTDLEPHKTPLATHETKTEHASLRRTHACAPS